MGWFKDFWDAGPFSGPGTPFDGGGKYTEKDAARERGISVKEVRQTWHQAREDAGMGELPNRVPDDKCNYGHKD